MNGNDLIEFEEHHPELQEKFLEENGMDILLDDIKTNKLESDEYWKFVEEEYNNRLV